MAQPRTYIALIVAVCTSMYGANVEACRIDSQEGLKMPRAVDSTYDPLPGPYLGSVDEHGSLLDVGVVQNAVRSWRGPALAAFSLCFQPAEQPVNWGLALAALKNVSHDLRSQGSAIVVIAAERVCSTPPNSSMKGKNHVEIKGVIQVPS
jgi:hypothetical protein